jgi:hypothetical protein
VPMRFFFTSPTCLRVLSCFFTAWWTLASSPSHSCLPAAERRAGRCSRRADEPHGGVDGGGGAGTRLP